jgi:hypothetical protein
MEDNREITVPKEFIKNIPSLKYTPLKYIFGKYNLKHKPNT